MEVNPSSLYYTPKGESEENLAIMQEMDKISLDHPTAGIKTMVFMLSMFGYHANHKRVRRLLRKMGIEAIYPQKCLSKGGKNAQYRAAYLLRNLPITHSNQVWSTDISYIPMAHGFMYLYAIIDVYSRCIVGWRLSNTLHAGNCIALLDECVARHGAPEIINTDQGTQYTGLEWKEALDRHGIRMSMDGRGRCKDNIWIERFWRTIKQEYIYLNPADNGVELRAGIAQYIMYYNRQRPHQSLNGQIPEEYYYRQAA